MNWGAIATDVLLSPAAINIYVIIAGILIGWLFDNYFNKPAIKAIAIEIAIAIEKETEEGTPLDTFLDRFINQVKEIKGREPTAGELKTALDLRNKTIKLNFNNKF